MDRHIKARIAELEEEIAPGRVHAAIAAIDESGFCTITRLDYWHDVREVVLQGIAEGKCADPEGCAREALTNVS